MTETKPEPRVRGGGYTSCVSRLCCCLVAEVFIFIFIFFKYMRLLLGNDKIILGEIDLLGLIFFSFAIGNFCCCANVFGFVYFLLDSRSIKFLWPLKRENC